METEELCAVRDEAHILTTEIVCEKINIKWKIVSINVFPAILYKLCLNWKLEVYFL